jgi:DNA-binding winged helix-turn-helix (wHTH) protein/tetratricopeptide (TPR) repeat protein
MSQRIYHFEPYRLVPATRELWRGEERIVVPARVFACLEYLIEQRGRAVGRAELIRAIWHRDNVSDIRLGQLVLLARRAVGDEGNSQRTIRTVVGFGYHWIAPTRVEDDAGPAAQPPAEDAPALIAAPPVRPTRVEPLPTSSAATAARARRRGALAVAMLLLVAAAAVGLRAWRGSAPAAADAAERRVLVCPLEVSGGDEVAWARLGGMDLVADRLRRSGLSVVPSETVLGLLRGTADADRLRALSGASTLVAGELSRDGRRWTARIEAGLAAGERLRAEAGADEPMEALRAATDTLLARFGRALAPDASTPQTADVLQRVRAALLADDPAQARAILAAVDERAVRDAPEVRLAAAQVDVRAGRFAEAEAALDALLPTLDASDNPRLRMHALGSRGMARLRIGRLAEAREDFDAALAMPAAATLRPEYADALNGRGIAAVALHEDDAATTFLGGARLEYDRDGDALGVARVDLNLGLADYERGSFAQASARFERSLAVFADLGAVRELSSALGAQMTLQSSQLQNEAALATSERFWAAIERAGDPAQRRGTTLRRAAALAGVGRLREAHALLDAVLAAADAHLVETRDFERLKLLETELALREGRAEDAARAAAALPVEPLPFGDDDLRASAALVRERAIPTSDVGEVGTRLDAIAAAPRTAASPLRALALAERAARAGRTEPAARAYRLALAQAEAGGVPRTIATIAASYVPWLIDHDRSAEAAALVGRLGPWAERDFDCALARLRVAAAQDDAGFRREALAAVRRLAGERPIPPALADAGDSAGLLR